MTEYERQLINDQISKLEKQLETYRKSLGKPVAWAKVNENGDLYDLRLQNNPYNDQTKVVPLYRIIND